MVLQKVIGWVDNFAVEERQASKLGCVLTILAYVAASAYLAYIITTWLADPVSTAVSFDFSNTAPSQLTLVCKSECGCAFQSKFSTACAGSTASGKIGFNARQTLNICPGTAWDDGIFITGSIRAIGLSVVWYVPNTAQADNLAPLPATNLLDRQSSKLVHLRETRITTYEAPDASTSAFQIGYVSEGPQCPTAPPTAACDLSGLFMAANSTDVGRFGFRPGGGGSRKRQQNIGDALRSCYLLQIDPLRTLAHTQLAYSPASALGIYGGALDIALLIGSVLFCLISCGRASKHKIEKEMVTARPGDA
jgi:hypothetical protein